VWIQRYFRALFGTALGRALFIAGFISTAMTYVSVYFPQIHLPRWILIAIAFLALLFAPSRLYFRMEERIEQLERERVAFFEEPQISFSVRWSEEGPATGRMQLVVTNEGKSPLRSFQLHTLLLGPFQVNFERIANLEPNREREIEYTNSGASNRQKADLLDLLTIARNNLHSTVYPVDGESHKNERRSP
jgi:hypothetical protein